MVKTPGSVDRVRVRKTRSDKGKRRKFYRGRKIKRRRKYNGKLVPYVSKRNEGDPIKFWFWDVQRMSVDGLHHWNKKLRIKVHRNVYGKNRVRIDIYPSDINTKEKFENYCAEILWEGNWLVLMWTSKKNKFHTSARAVATVKIKETSEGKKARLTPSYKNTGLYRYRWFFKS